MTCLLCGNPFQPEEFKIVIPRAYVHRQCQDFDGRLPDEIGKTLIDSPLRELLGAFCGGTFELTPGIPEDVLFISNPEKKTVTRFRYHATGPVVFEKLDEIDLSKSIFPVDWEAEIKPEVKKDAEAPEGSTPLPMRDVPGSGDLEPAEG